MSFVPTIKEIVRIPKDPPKPLGAAHKKRRHTTPRSKSETVVATDDPEEGWDEKTPTNGVVVDWFTGNEVQRRTFTISLLIHNDFSLTCVSQVLPSQGAWLNIAPLQTKTFSLQKCSEMESISRPDNFEYLRTRTSPAR